MDYAPWIMVSGFLVFGIIIVFVSDAGGWIKRRWMGRDGHDTK
jgi:hypothetical protein